MFQHVALVGLGGAGEAGAQRMSGEFSSPRPSVRLLRTPAASAVFVHQPRDVLVGQALDVDGLAVGEHAPQQRTMADPAEFQLVCRVDLRLAQELSAERFHLLQNLGRPSNSSLAAPSLHALRLSLASRSTFLNRPGSSIAMDLPR